MKIQNSKRFEVKDTRSLHLQCLLLFALCLGLLLGGNGCAPERSAPHSGVPARVEQPSLRSTLPLRGPAPTFQSASAPGPYQVKTLTQPDGLRDGPDYSTATIYYPIDADPPFATIVIVPGYVSPEFTIQAWGPFYASHGIVTMTIGTNKLREYPKSRRDALLDAIATLRAEHSRSGSPLEGRLARDRIAVSGWSMGGGACQLAAVADPTLKAVVALCPWEPAGIFNHPSPVLIIGGSTDKLAPFDEHALAHYRQTPETTPKLMYEVDGQGHWVVYGPGGGDSDVGRLALSWLKVFLEGDERYRPFLLVKPETASRYETNLN